jgi:hypothetical protein
MNISADRSTVRFKTEPEELFLAEKSGTKSNTVRILDIDEWRQLKEQDPKKIIIQYQQEIFLRTLSNIHFGGVILGKVIAIFSWTNENHHHAPPVGSPGIPLEPGDHNLVNEDLQVPPIPPICKCANCIKGNEIKADFHVHTTGLDEVEGSCNSPKLSQIPIAKTMRCPECEGDILKSRAGEFGKCAICQALFYLDPEMEPSAEEPAPDHNFVAICISKQMCNMLQNSFSGRTMNSIVQELYETYIYKLEEERALLDD